jgi:hypothetical protein
MNFLLELIKYNEFLKIINNSDFILEVYLVPKKPKRKVNMEIVIYPKQSYTIDHKYNCNLNEYFFRFIEDK